MFAGRYGWWLITATAALLICLIGFDGVTWFMLGISDCARSETGCYALGGWMLGSLKPMLATLAGGVLVLAVLIRIAWLRFLPLWFVPVLVWSAAAAGTLRAYLPLWNGSADYMALARQMPPATYAFVALAIFLAFPLEEEDVPVRGQAAPIGAVAGFAAFACTLQVLATASSLPLSLARTFHLVDLANMLGSAQALLSTFLQLNNGNMIPGLIMVMLFALALALRIVRHERLTAGAA